MIIWSKDHLKSAEWWSDQFYANYEAHGPVRWLIQGLGLVNLYQTEKVLFQSECMHLILKVTSFGFRQSSCGLERSRVDGDLELRRPSGSLQSDLDRLNVCESAAEGFTVNWNKYFGREIRVMPLTERAYGRFIRAIKALRLSRWGQRRSARHICSVIILFCLTVSALCLFLLSGNTNER